MSKKKSNQSLRGFHTEGNQANEKAVARQSKGAGTWGTLEMLGAHSSADRNRLMESRRFARLCDNEELDFLCALGKGKRWKITRSHILQLIRVPERALRKNVARRCAEKAWSTRELQREIDRLGRHRLYGGRKHKVPESDVEAFLTTERMVASWMRWVSVLKEPKKDSKKRITLNKLPKPVRQKLVAVSEKAEELREEILKQLNRKPPKLRKTSRRPVR